MNTTIYLTTLKKVMKNNFVIFMLFVFAVLGPVAISLSPADPSITSGDAFDAFLNSALVGLFVITTSNIIGSALTIGGRSDYMPLIVTRPLHRFQYVLSKWLALATIILIVSLTQQLIYTCTGAYARWGMTPSMISLGFPERVISALCVGSVLTLIYLLPKQQMVLVGIVSFEAATIFSMFNYSLNIPMSSSSSKLAEMYAAILGIDTWAKTQLLPSIFGGNALDSLHQYMLTLSSVCNFLAPQVFVYDIFYARPFQWLPVLEVSSNTLLALTLATLVLNAREYHYDSD